MTKPKKPNYPKRAETRFQLLCDDVDLTRHKSTDDRTGWDYLIEFDRPSIAGLPHDQQPGSSTARVQVKSKVGGKPRTSFKLTNALRFTREPDICFVVLFWFSSDGETERIYARHFHSQLMEATLKRAREADRDGITALNRILLPIPFTDADDHTGDLVAWIQSFCDQQPESYAGDKKALRDSLGNDGVQYSGNFTVPYDQLQTLIDHSVGLAPVAPIDHVTIHNRRFDIPAKTPLFDDKPDEARISVNPEAATLTIVGENGRIANLHGEVRSFGFPGLPIEMARMAFTSACVSAVLKGNGEFEISYEIESRAAISLRALKEVASFFQAAQSPMAASLAVAGRISIETSAPAVMNLHDQWFDWLDEAVDSLLKVCQANDDPVVTIQELIDADDGIFSLSACLDDGEATLKFAATEMLAEMPTAKNLLGFDRAQIGANTYWVVCRRPCLKQEEEDDRYTFVFGDPVLLAQGISSEPISTETLNERMVKLAKRMGGGTVVFNEGDMGSLSSGVLNIGFL
ncbi:hypothetical protein U1839_00735 [Sphingomonas sp. RT2P30]|uniref:hypothetical protein n=1 Tax=Parasphingomonas halimpatiens TaxID=3096162 RepID=UPI002FC6A5DB